MTYLSSDKDAFAHDVRLAAVFIDYQNLYSLLRERLGAGASPDEYIADALDELKRYLLDADSTRTAQTIAYADFNALRGNEQIERALFARSVEPRFVPASLQPNASEVQLCVDAVDLLHRRPDLGTFVLVTGDRAYLPLVQAFKRYGRHVFVAALVTPPAADSFGFAEGDVFLGFLNLVGRPARRRLEGAGGRPASARPSPITEADTPHAAPSTGTFQNLSNPTTFRALEVAEEYFGQYEEVYLTPLLRKLSELLGEAYDPKSLVSELEEAGAVRLEKREGYPYDYTVLIVHHQHPDVQKVREQLREATEGYHSADHLSDSEAEARLSYLDDYTDLQMSSYEDEEDVDGEPAGNKPEEYASEGYDDEAWEEERS